MRDRLIEIILEYFSGNVDNYDLADHLLANGVIVQPNCAECIFDDGLKWYQCERCVGGKINAFVSIKEVE